MAQLERLPAGAETDLAWSAVGDEIQLDLSMPGDLSDIRYDGSVPDPKTREGEQLRLALREYEIFLTDESESDARVTRRGSLFSHSRGSGR